MPTKSISVKIDETLWNSMKLHEDINWSGVIRTRIREKLEEIEELPFDKERAERALKHSEQLRKQVKGGKPGEEIIREWRDKRR